MFFFFLILTSHRRRQRCPSCRSNCACSFCGSLRDHASHSCSIVVKWGQDEKQEEGKGDYTRHCLLCLLSSGSLHIYIYIYIYIGRRKVSSEELLFYFIHLLLLETRSFFFPSPSSLLFFSFLLFFFFAFFKKKTQYSKGFIRSPSSLSRLTHTLLSLPQQRPKYCFFFFLLLLLLLREKACVCVCVR